MNTKQELSALVDCVAIVIQPGTIRRADLTKNGPGSPHDFRDSKAITDFNQFSTRHDHFMAAGQLIENEVDRCGIVVHDDAWCSD